MAEIFDRTCLYNTSAVVSDRLSTNPRSNAARWVFGIGSSLESLDVILGLQGLRTMSYTK